MLSNLLAIGLDFFNVYGKNLIIAALILALGLLMINRISKILIMFLLKSNADSGFVSILDSLMKFLLSILIAVLVLSALKIDVLSVIAAISASFLAIGLALKDNIANLASGILVVLSKQIHIGDKIKSGQFEGIVIRIETMFTILLNDNKETVVVPNSKLISSVIIRESTWNLCYFNFKYNLKNVKKIKEIERAFEYYVLIPENKILSNPPSGFRFTSNENEKSEINLTIWTYKHNSKSTIDSLNRFMETQFKKMNIENISFEISDNIIIV
ncbi:MAG: mechanosensitive ion channel family protein [Oscillospiraceae bacterium]|nr:mechanosensitive ion channel family protein [Oscillospiraceae bacterium]